MRREDCSGFEPSVLHLGNEGRVKELMTHLQAMYRVDDAIWHKYPP